MTDEHRNRAPQIERRAVDHVKTVMCANCGENVETPRDEPWIITGQEQYAPQLVSFICPHCGAEIAVD